MAEIGRRHGLITVCDNTFANVQRPLEHGIDIVFHSAKNIKRCSDLVGGVAVVRADTQHGWIADRAVLAKRCQNLIAPFDRYGLRSLKTFPFV